MTNLVWYASYGSNMLRERFMYYITGGYLKEYARHHRGCPDITPPRDDITLEISGRLYFGWHPAYGPKLPSILFERQQAGEKVKIRAYLITLDQLQHILAQESKIAEPLHIDLTALQTKGELKVLRDAFFDELVYLGDHKGHPIITFTSSGENVTPGVPGPQYLELLTRGLMDAHGFTREQAVDYWKRR